MAAVVWVAGQLAFGLARPYLAHELCMTGSTPTSLRTIDSKTKYSFDLRPMLAQAHAASCVQLDIPDAFLEYYAMLALYDHGIAFRFDHNVNTRFGTSGKDLGKSVWARPADWRVFVAPPAETNGLSCLAIEPVRRAGE